MSLPIRPPHWPENFRDVGEALGLGSDPAPIAIGRVFRGGRFDTLATLEDLGSPRTIVNLRRGPDPEHLGAVVIHIPAPDDLENYETKNRRVSGWVTKALRALASPSTAWPVYIHCTRGRDRTGVIVAALLNALGVPPKTIVEEYALSDGADPTLIRQALHGLGTVRLEPPELAQLKQSLAPVSQAPSSPKIRSSSSKDP